MQKHPSPLNFHAFLKAKFALLYQSRKSVLPRRADEAEADVAVPAEGGVVSPIRDGTD